VAGVVWQWRRAVANEHVANRLTDEAEARTKLERWERYRSNMAEAGSALQQQNFDAVRRAIKAAPAEHRGWEWRYFSSQIADGALITLQVGTPASHYCPFFAVHPARWQIAINTPDGSVTWWDPTLGPQFAPSRSHPKAASPTAYSPDGTLVATAADDYAIHL
jgi:hypothetical protein